MTKCNDFDNQLRETFLKCFKKQFNIFVNKMKANKACQNCEDCNISCKGIDSLSGQKNCLVSKIAKCNDDEFCSTGAQTIDLWLSGKSNHLPNVSLLKKVSLVMGCKLDDFFDDSREEENDDALTTEFKNQLLGHYAVYQFNPVAKKFSFGALSISLDTISNKLRANAIFKWRDSKKMTDIVSKLQEKKISLNEAYKTNSYKGNVQLTKDGAYIDVSHTQPTINDRVFIIIPNTLKFQENIALQENKVKYEGKLLGGYGIATCLNNHYFRESLSFPFIFSKLPIEVDTEAENIDKIIKQIEQGEEECETFTANIVQALYNKNLCITADMEENLIEYLMDDVE